MLLFASQFRFECKPCIRNNNAGACCLSRSGTNNSAIFSEIVPEQLRSAIYAFDRSFEGAVGATAAPLVGTYWLGRLHKYFPTCSASTT